MAPITGSWLNASSAAADVLLAGAAARGLFGWEAMGGYERVVGQELKEAPIDFPLRIEGHFATRDRVTNIVLSTYALAHLTIPGFKDSDFSPYVSTGPGFHIQGSYSDLGAVGDVLANGEAALKWHFLIGAILARGERLDVYTESRYTIPSSFDFDYIALGVRVHGRDSSQPSQP
jgi:hypothetical protein